MEINERVKFSLSLPPEQNYWLPTHAPTCPFGGFEGRTAVARSRHCRVTYHQADTSCKVLTRRVSYIPRLFAFPFANILRSSSILVVSIRKSSFSIILPLSQTGRQVGAEAESVLVVVS